MLQKKSKEDDPYHNRLLVENVNLGGELQVVIQMVVRIK